MDLPLPFLLCLIFLVLLPCSAMSQRNISLGSSITAGTNGSLWESASGDFAFGFKEITAGSGSFLLAIWFNKIPEKTVVWWAHNGNLVQNGSKIQLTSDGRLVLIDPTGQEIWSAGKTSASYAAMLDTGNFVLADQDAVNLWESFDQPTDTFLPTQPFKEGTRLSSRFSAANYTNGKFEFELQEDGNLVLYIIEYPRDFVEFVKSAYWATDIMGSGHQLIFNQTGNIYLINQNKTVLASVLSDPNSTTNSTNFYRRAVLDFDGVLRQYVYPKAGGSSSGGSQNAWSVSSNIPPNICTAINGDTSSGACGFNGLCQLEDDQRPKCLCPRGYSFIDPNNEMSGCKQDYDSQSCLEELQDKNLFDVSEMKDTNWTSGDYEQFGPVTEDQCRDACLGDCFCGVAIFNGDKFCFKKRLPLSNGRIDPSVGGKAFVKYTVKNNTAPRTDENDSPKKENDNSTLILPGAVLLGGSVFLNCLLLLVTLLIILHFNKRNPKAVQALPPVLAMNLPSFTYKEMEEATDGFKEEVGRGACAIVYKGIIQFENKRLVAVKKLDKMVAEADKEFKNEVSAIGRTNHRNLVRLLGFCNEGPHHLLVYEFMANGSLADFLFGNPRPRYGNLECLVENDEEAKDDIMRVRKSVMIAIWCIQDDPSMRPTMRKVIQMLEGAVEVPAPPDPSSYMSAI
ncbi:Bulb-type lectin domain [Dillenia turbinata]|uniref:non-specific serine/threonine protein kinase n=1 Tax=Dillenia turbinata TaxID=194707 RepID=A0AAN8VN09_9MAGN